MKREERRSLNKFFDKNTSQRRIYLDHNATTPVHSRVLKVMMPYFSKHFGNASSFYKLGRDARIAVENSRKTVAKLIGAKPEEIIFTSGGTESDNLAIKGVSYALREKGNHIITSSIEHHAVLRTCESLEKEGFKVTYLPVGRDGRVDPNEVKKAISSRTILITIMYANNETGVIQPIAEIGKIARTNGIIFHTDAVQAAGKLPIDVDKLYVDLLSISAHKIYGPKGVGALFIRNGVPFVPILCGGHHERGMRAGTENVPAIVGFAEAFSIVTSDIEKETKRLSLLRNRFEECLIEKIEGIHINGKDAPRVPQTSNISFLSIDGESILLHLDLKGIYASSGSACTTGSSEPSYVLLAMGVPSQQAQSSIRFSLGRENTKEDIDFTVDTLIEIVTKLRAISTLQAV